MADSDIRTMQTFMSRLTAARPQALNDARSKYRAMFVVRAVGPDADNDHSRFWRDLHFQCAPVLDCDVTPTPRLLSVSATAEGRTAIRKIHAFEIERGGIIGEPWDIEDKDVATRALSVILDLNDGSEALNAAYREIADQLRDVNWEALEQFLNGPEIVNSAHLST